MSKDDYNPQSIDATLSRIETKLDGALAIQGQHAELIEKQSTALQRLDVRVAVISGGVSVAAFIIKLVFFHS